MDRLVIHKTHDGSHTFYSSKLGEYYHSIFGAVNESVHVFINSAFSHHQAKEVSIFEMGFGTGLNVLLTMLRAGEERRKVVYHSIEKFPLSVELVQQLNYPDLFSGEGALWFEAIQSCAWEKDYRITDFFTLRKLRGDLAYHDFEGRYDIIYFDAFSPDKQPELWSVDIFSRLYDIMNPGGILTTYSSKSLVRRAMESGGFEVEKTPGPPGKREMLRATKSI